MPNCSLILLARHQLRIRCMARDNLFCFSCEVLQCDLDRMGYHESFWTAKPDQQLSHARQYLMSRRSRNVYPFHADLSMTCIPLYRESQVELKLGQPHSISEQNRRIKKGSFFRDFFCQNPTSAGSLVLGGLTPSARPARQGALACWRRG